jgi:hypothetical protein
MHRSNSFLHVVSVPVPDLRKKNKLCQYMPSMHTAEVVLYVYPYSESVLQGGGWQALCPGILTPLEGNPLPI